MRSSAFRRPLALASVFAVGATAFVAGSTAAHASLPGSGSTLTSSNGSNSIAIAGAASLGLPEQVFDAAWSPDGSRALYINERNDLATVRYNDGNNIWWDFPVAPAGTVRESPSWRGDGSTAVWAEKPSGGLWSVKLGVDGAGWTPVTISPDDTNNYLNPDGGPDLRVVFERQAVGAGTPAVMLYDPSKPAPEVVDDNGANPAISPDGTKVAFVRSDGTNNQIVVTDLAGNNDLAVTSNAANHDNPTWSPDGATIAFSQGIGVATAAADGSTAANPTMTGLTGVPAYRPQHQDRVVRLSGANRYTTATAVSQSHWATASDSGDPRARATSVVLSRSDTFADALGGSALAAAKNGPLLMTLPGSLDLSTTAEIQRVLAPGGTVYLLGGTGAISDAVKNQIAALGYTTQRLAGADRYSTSIAIADAIDTTPDLVLAATGVNFPDALAAGAAAGSFNTPGAGSGLSAVVVLTKDTTLMPATKAYLDVLSPDSVVFGIGGQAFTATQAYNPVDVVGTNRYWTALYTAWTFFAGENYAGVATGTNWPDALSGGALMAVLNGPLLLTAGDTTTLSLQAELVFDEYSGSIHTGLIFGGTGAVNGAQDNQIGMWLSGPAGFSKVTNPTNVGIAPTSTMRTLSADGSTATPSPSTDANLHRSPADLRTAAKAVQDKAARELTAR